MVFDMIGHQALYLWITGLCVALHILWFHHIRVFVLPYSVMNQLTHLHDTYKGCWLIETIQFHSCFAFWQWTLAKIVVDMPLFVHSLLYMFFVVSLYVL